MPEPNLDTGALFSAIQFAQRDCVVVAVSGGGDSLALLFLLNDYLQNLPSQRPSLLAVTIDHGLRAESAEEAAEVGRICSSHGVSHRILRWEGRKPVTGISASAREARLELLARAAAEAQTDIVLTGHTADDQAETIAMREARGAGRGEAGIAPATLHNETTWFVRPLLSVRREALRAYLRAQRISWIEDPSNKDRRFERARIRQTLGEEAARRLIGKAEQMAAAREELGEKAAALIRHAVAMDSPGLLRLQLSLLEEADREAALYTLRILLAVSGGMPHLPGQAAAGKVLAAARVKSFRANLSRAVISNRSGQVFLNREARSIPEGPLLEGAIWDGRFRVVSDGAQPGVTIAPLGAGNTTGMPAGGADVPASLAKAALAAEPALWVDGTCLGLASAAGEKLLRPVAGPWARLLPSFDVAPARALMALLGGAALPAVPVASRRGPEITI